MMFVYLIVKEIKNSNEDDQSKPAKDLIYYQLIIYLIIGLDIISGVFRFLGCIFMITLVKLLYKMKRSTIDSLLKKIKFYFFN